MQQEAESFAEIIFSAGKVLLVVENYFCDRPDN